LGTVERASSGETIREDKFENNASSDWSDYGAKSTHGGGRLSANGATVAVVNGVDETNVRVAVDAHGDGNAGLVLRFHDADNYLAAVYSNKEKVIYLLDRNQGADGHPLRSTPVPDIGSNIRLTAEARGGWAAVSVTDGKHTYSSGIVHVRNTTAGSAGIMHRNDGATQSFGNFELRNSPTLVTDQHLERKLYDARGVYRGEMVGPGLDLGPGMESLGVGWSDFGKEKLILLDAYRPPRLPTAGDWVLVLENRK